MSTVFLVGLLLAPPSAAEDQAPAGVPAKDPGTAVGAEGSGDGALLAEIRGLCPDHEAAAGQGREAADRILQAIEEGAGSFRADPSAPEGTSSAAREARARFIAVELYRLAGADREARAELADISAAGPRDEDRARALYLLGEEYFLKEAYLPRTGRTGRPRPSAYVYWTQLAERFPASPWAKDIERPLRYLRLLRGAPAPRFEGSFEAGERSVALSPEVLKGRILVASFWQGATSAEREFQKDLRAGLESLVPSGGEIPERKGAAAMVEVVGVNLDTDRKAFEKAVEDWDLRRPQLHDGKGFATPLADRFGIPRAPHWLVLDQEGNVAYLGADPAACLAKVLRLAGGP